MKKRILSILILGAVLSSFSLHAQWRLSPAYNTSTNDIMFVDNSIGYQVGRFGYMTKTIDGGLTWKALASRVNNKDFYSVYFPSTTLGYAGGDGIFLKTIDGGNTWLYLNGLSGGKMTGIYFLNENIGWVCANDGKIFSTIDGGYNWNTYASSNNFNDIFFTSPSKGWAVGTSGVVLKTNDGGQTWNSAGLPITNTIDVEKVEFIDVNTGWIATSGGIVYRTTDGGANWQANSTAIPYIYDISFVSSTVGFAGTASGVYKTTDGGATWALSGHTSSVYCLDFYSLTNGTIGDKAGINYYTQDGAASWLSISDESNYNLNGYSIFMVTPSLGWSVGENGMIRKTTNGGDSWLNQSSGASSVLLAVSFQNSLEGWAAGFNGEIRKTSNGGTNWIGQTSGTTNNLYGMYFFSTASGVVVGDVGKIIKTTDGGATWSNITSGTTSTLRAVHFITNTGWVVGAGGTILKSTNYGDTWSALNSGTTTNLLSVHFPNGSIGYAVGLNGTILKTNDGGTTWNTQTSNTANHLTSVYFTSTTEGWAAGYNGTILHTLNGGTTWTDLNLGFTLQPLNAVHFTSSGLGHILGNSGTLLQYQSSCAPPAPVDYTFSTSTKVCNGSNTILMASGIGKIGWWTAPTGGTYLGEGFTLGGGSHYFAPTLTSTTTFYVEDFTCSASLSRTPITVTVNSTSPTNATTQTGIDLSAVEVSSGVEYQWMNCSNYFKIPGQNNQTFTPTKNGDYAVEVNLGGCMDTSACISITTITGTNNSIESENISLFPIPATNELTINYGKLNGTECLLKIMDITGKVVWSKRTNGNNETLNIQTLESGFYLLEVEANGKYFRKNIIKN